jgi:hypothetical protein
MFSFRKDFPNSIAASLNVSYAALSRPRKAMVLRTFMLREFDVMGRAAYRRIYAIDTMRRIVLEDLVILYCVDKLYSSLAEVISSEPSKKAFVISSSDEDSI